MGDKLDDARPVPGYFQQSEAAQKLMERFAADPAVKAFLEPGVPEVERRASHDLEALEAYASSKREVIPGHGRFCPAAVPGNKAICNCKEPVAPAEGFTIKDPERTFLHREHLMTFTPPPTFAESWASYRSALYAIHSTLGVAHSLLHLECMRTPVGSDAWETLRAFASKVNAVSEALAKEIERVPEGNGLVE